MVVATTCATLSVNGWVVLTAVMCKGTSATSHVKAVSTVGFLGAGSTDGYIDC